MENADPKLKKRILNTSTSQEAYDLTLLYCTPRTMGAFISELIVTHHARHKKGKRTGKELAAELRALADEVEQA